METNLWCLLLSVQPSRALVDEKFSVRVQNAPPAHRLTVHALLHSEDGDDWEAFGHYVTDAGGDVNGPGPFPGLMDLWGASGGLVEYRSALLASHGFASLALDYLKQADVKNEYFEDAYRVLQQHPQVCKNRIGLVGISFGSSVALKMSVYSNVIQPRCLVCVCASHVQPVEGTVADCFADVRNNKTKVLCSEENQLIWRNVLLPIPTDTSKKVDVGQLQCPLLLVVGEDDQNMPVSESADDMREMMERAGNSHLLTVLSYPRTGHLIEPPYSPHCRASKFITLLHKERVMMLWGGEAAPHSHAQEDAWRKMLDFLKENLYCSAN